MKPKLYVVIYRSMKIRERLPVAEILKKFSEYEFWFQKRELRRGLFRLSFEEQFFEFHQFWENRQFSKNFKNKVLLPWMAIKIYSFGERFKEIVF